MQVRWLKYWLPHMDIEYDQTLFSWIIGTSFKGELLYIVLATPVIQLIIVVETARKIQTGR